MIISLGDKFINMDNVLYVEDFTSHTGEIIIFFIDKEKGLHLSGDYAEKVLTYLERTAEKPMRRKKLRHEMEEEVYEKEEEETEDLSKMSFKELQKRNVTMGEYQNATKHLPRR